MLKNAYLLPKIGADTAENELNFAEILPTGAFDLSALSRVVRTPGCPPQPGYTSSTNKVAHGMNDLHEPQCIGTASQIFEESDRINTEEERERSD